jgi:hypothetical protein
LTAKATFTPKDLGAAIRATFKTPRIIMFDVGELMTFVRDGDKCRADAADPGPADPPVSHRIEQYSKSAKVCRV